MVAAAVAKVYRHGASRLGIPGGFFCLLNVVETTGLSTCPSIWNGISITHGTGNVAVVHHHR
jgi:hypothetical protein